MNISQHWRLKANRYQLQANRHEDGTVTFPARPYVEQRSVERYVFKDQEETLANTTLETVA